MNPYIQADSAQDLKVRLVNDWESVEIRKLTETERNERCQILRFFEIAASNPFIRYPLSLFPTSNKNPDFRLEMPNLSVGIEASCITNEQMERADRLEAVQNSSDSPDAFLVPGPKRTNPQLKKVATDFYGEWNNVEDVTDFWNAQALNVIARKTKIRQRNDYTDYGCNWLLLLDKLSIIPNGVEFPIRVESLGVKLRQKAYWSHSCCFDSIIIYDNPSKRLAVISPDTTELFTD